MDAAMIASLLTTVRETAQLLFSSPPESLALVFWGCGLLAVGAGVRSLIAAKPLLRDNQAHHIQAGGPYSAEDRALTESRA